MVNMYCSCRVQGVEERSCRSWILQASRAWAQVKVLQWGRPYVSPSLGLVSFLLSRCFGPSQPQRITSGLNTNFTPSPSHSFHKSSNHKSCFSSLFMFRGHSTQEPASRRVTYLFCGPTQELVLVTAKTGKNRERFWKKNAGEWTERVEISREEIPGMQ